MINTVLLRAKIIVSSNGVHTQMWSGNSITTHLKTYFCPPVLMEPLKCGTQESLMEKTFSLALVSDQFIKKTENNQIVVLLTYLLQLLGCLKTKLFLDMPLLLILLCLTPILLKSQIFLSLTPRTISHLPSLTRFCIIKAWM